MSSSDIEDTPREGPAREPDPRYRLDPARLPQRLDLTLTPELLDRLEELAIRSGRSIDEIAAELIDGKLQDRVVEQVAFLIGHHRHQEAIQ